MFHAKDDAAKAFYERIGFELTPGDRHRVFLLMKNMKASLGILGR
jgi:hypothetical protein